MTASEFRFAHLADAHVGAWARNPAIRSALRESVVGAIDTAEARDCEFLLISGDLFHTPVPEPSEAAPVAAALRRFVRAGRRVYAIYGSHDYVAHRTSWLDVLAETGIFVKAAPEAVREEGTRWSLPFLTDEPTGARIAGVSGRSNGLDRSYFASLDAEAFRAAEGFRIFQFHAAVQEYLPVALRDHIVGVSKADLPGGCDYYAGGHIHYTYEGTAPDGGRIVNPGAVFGTSVTDLEYALAGTMKQGFVEVGVRGGRVDRVEWVETAPKDRLRVLEIDVSGRTVEEAKRLVREEVASAARPGALLFPRLSGRLADGSVTALGLMESAGAAGARGAAGVQWEIEGLEPSGGPPVGPESLPELELRALRALAEGAATTPADLRGDAGLVRLEALLRELATSRGEGEARADYENARVQGALKLLASRAGGGGG